MMRDKENKSANNFMQINKIADYKTANTIF